jgi:hypothetical protein
VVPDAAKLLFRVSGFGRGNLPDARAAFLTIPFFAAVLKKPRTEPHRLATGLAKKL